MVTAPRGAKRSAEDAPDDLRATNTDPPEVESRGEKRRAEFEPDDPRLVAGGDESEVVNDMPTTTGVPVVHRPASSLGRPFQAVFVPQEGGHTTPKGQDNADNEGTDPGDVSGARANGEDGQEEITNDSAY